jgi:hypothetical protein
MDLTERFKKPTKVNQSLPRLGSMVSVDGLPEMGVDCIGMIDYGDYGSQIMVYLQNNKEWAYWNNCTRFDND